MTTPTDVTTAADAALKAEELWSWERQRFANRHIVWDILDARKSVAA